MSKYKCRNCKEIVTSNYRHNFNSCSCFKKTSEDAYRVALKMREYLDMSSSNTYDKESVVHLVECAVNSVLGHGFFIDGGDDYRRMGGNTNDMEKID